MNLDFTLNLSDLETLLTKSHCSCHFINPHKTRILMWKETKLPEDQTKNDQITYHLRIGIQKFSSHDQVDRNGETYWRYYAPELKPEQVSKEEAKPTPSPNQTN